MTKILVVAPLDRLFEPTAVAVKGLGAWPATRCKACGWIVTVDHPSKIPAHECGPKMYESESVTSMKPVKRSRALKELETLGEK